MFHVELLVLAREDHLGGLGDAGMRLHDADLQESGSGILPHKYRSTLSKNHIEDQRFANFLGRTQ